MGLSAGQTAPCGLSEDPDRAGRLWEDGQEGWVSARASLGRKLLEERGSGELPYKARSVDWL